VLQVGEIVYGRAEQRRRLRRERINFGSEPRPTRRSGKMNCGTWLSRSCVTRINLRQCASLTRCDAIERAYSDLSSSPRKPLKELQMKKSAVARSAEVRRNLANPQLTQALQRTHSRKARCE
jgi:ribosomal protein L20A (L18A)